MSVYDRRGSDILEDGALEEELGLRDYDMVRRRLRLLFSPWDESVNGFHLGEGVLSSLLGHNKEK